LSTIFVYHLVFGYGFNDEIIFVITFLVEPVFDAGDGFSDVVSSSFKFIVINVLIVVQIRLINKMPSGLPTTSVVLDVISKSDTFGESMLVFSNWESIFLKDRENGLNLGDNFWVSLLENFLSNSGGHKMSWSTPGGDCSSKS